LENSPKNGENPNIESSKSLQIGQKMGLKLPIIETFSELQRKKEEITGFSPNEIQFGDSGGP